MDANALARKAQGYLQRLCLEIPERPTGSPGNQMAADFFEATAASLGLPVESTPFECLDWEQAGADLRVNGEAYQVKVSPYSLGGRASAPLIALASPEALEAAEIEGKIVLLHGELAREQLMPKNFPFYNPEEHQRITGLLESKRPAAIVAATGRNPELAGALYPFPLIEDGDFNVPSVYMTEEEGRRLLEGVGLTAELDIRSQRIPSSGRNLTLQIGDPSGQQIAVVAHLDAKVGTPGALDNGTGIVTLLLLAELLAAYQGRPGVTITALNGEDYYGANGEIAYVKRLEKKENFLLGINIDGAGYREGRTTFSLYECPPALSDQVRAAFAGYPDLVEGEPWYQSDHMLFVQYGVPALAFTSDAFDDLWNRIAHTAGDRPELVDANKIAGLALALHELILKLG